MSPAEVPLERWEAAKYFSAGFGRRQAHLQANMPDRSPCAGLHRESPAGFAAGGLVRPGVYDFAPPHFQHEVNCGSEVSPQVGHFQSLPTTTAFALKAALISNASANW